MVNERSPSPPPDTTRERLLSEATRLFAERGPAGTSIRELAQAAGANVAAVHYHFGGKEGLYAAVVERAFSFVPQLRDVLAAQLDAARSAGTREAAAQAIRTCTHEFMRHLFRKGHSTWAALFLQREAMEPTETVTRAIDGLIGPVWDTCIALLALLRPDLKKRELRLIVSSIVGQCLFYQDHRALVLHVFGPSALDDVFVSRAADHIASFSLAALECR
jgi:AcrR family transcriptional regulator